MLSFKADAAELGIAAALFSSIAEEMGVTLGRSAHSPNIKERRDYSCAVFDPQGRLVAQAAHIPVHLGAMPTAVEAAMPLAPFATGDIVILNDPYLGGTHLPDITMVSPVFVRRTLAGFVASRAHHADVGGISPGSMPIAEELIQEGMVIPPIKLFERGRLNSAVLDLLIRNMRAPEERRGDFDAQVAAQHTGVERLREITGRYGLRRASVVMEALTDYAERMTRAALAAVPGGEYQFEDFLDDDGSSEEPVPIRVRLTFGAGTLHGDFSGSALLAFYIMQARLEVAVAKEREAVSEARIMLESQKKTMEETVKAVEESTRPSAARRRRPFGRCPQSRAPCR